MNSSTLKIAKCAAVPSSFKCESQITAAVLSRHGMKMKLDYGSMLIVNLETGETLARVGVQSNPDGVSYSPVQR